MRTWRWLALLLAVALAFGMTSACGGGKKEEKAQSKKQGKSKAAEYTPNELTVQFVPSRNAETLQAKIKPLEQTLSKQLGVPIHVSVAANYADLIEAMASKQVDVGFLPPTAYAAAKEKGVAKAVLQAQRLAIEPDTGQVVKDKKVDYYRSLIIVRKHSPIRTLQDLKGKTIAWQESSSSAGYVWPVVEMKRAGVDARKDVKGSVTKGYGAAVMAVVNSDADAAAIFEDARMLVKSDVPDVFARTRVLYVTQPIPNDTVSVRSDMGKKWQQKIQKAFTALMKQPESQAQMKSVYSHVGYKKFDDKQYEIIRQYGKEIGQ